MMMSLDKEQDDSDSDLEEKIETKKKETPVTKPVAESSSTNVDDSPAEVSSTSSRVTRSRETVVPTKAATPITSPTRSSRRQQVNI